MWRYRVYVRKGGGAGRGAGRQVRSGELVVWPILREVRSNGGGIIWTASAQEPRWSFARYRGDAEIPRL